MPRQKESALEILLKLAWWVSAVLGLIAFATLRWGAPIWAGTDNSRLVFSKGIVPLAPLPLLFSGIFATGTYWFGCHGRRLVYFALVREDAVARPIQAVPLGVLGYSLFILQTVAASLTQLCGF